MNTHEYSQPRIDGGERFQSRIPGLLLERSRSEELLLYLDTPYICHRAPAAGGVIRGHDLACLCSSSRRGIGGCVRPVISSHISM